MTTAEVYRYHLEQARPIGHNMWWIWDTTKLNLESRGYRLNDDDSAALQTQYQAYIHNGDWLAYEL